MEYQHTVAVTCRGLLTGDEVPDGGENEAYSPSVRRLLQCLPEICRLQPSAVLLREKDLSEEAYRALAREAIAICEAYGVPCILHQFAEVARELSQPRLHLPFSVFCERMQGPEREDMLRSFSMLGTSVHRAEEAELAERLGATYVTAGHIFSTDCKKGLAPRGLDFLQEVCERVTIPVWAIGGIGLDWESVAAVLARGASRACVMSGYMRAAGGKKE